ncbi:electron transport complex subunit RsxG [Methylotuvimicrobium buryatense]|uniref:Ion-translocating oxidoreductase complex subunit G n=1 Tax=Methylotuvimicrobium buryatense TaxID=95641 RepID=A0A4P9UP17_METBY|nr:electron transport complex subunit RsxG [Methylotuvimicrobium buryatense]QCW81266.1 electron transport complex subunit RsxG [Methylotuvimicrobium buryatense]
MNAIIKNTLSAATILGIFSLLGLGLTSLTFHKTEAKIQENERQALLANLKAVIPESLYDNDIVNDTLEVTDLNQDSTKPAVIYRARKKDNPVAAVMTVVTPFGYSGNITLLVAIKTDGTLTGVRAIAHRETPGLGDKIEIERSDWILAFDGKSLAMPKTQEWAVKRDDGYFDQFTGATITPRAVVGAVKNALLYFKHNQSLIFSTTESTPEGGN